MVCGKLNGREGSSLGMVIQGFVCSRRHHHRPLFSSFFILTSLPAFDHFFFHLHPSSINPSLFFWSISLRRVLCTFTCKSCFFWSRYFLYPQTQTKDILFVHLFTLSQTIVSASSFLDEYATIACVSAAFQAAVLSGHIFRRSLHLITC